MINARTYRVRLPALLALTLVSTIWGCTLGLAMNWAQANERELKEQRIYSAWNDMARSMIEENKILEELQENLKTNPPHLVFDARRLDLYKLAIAEHQRQLRDLETMQKEDR